jgi:hypothetical protein
LTKGFKPWKHNCNVKYLAKSERGKGKYLIKTLGDVDHGWLDPLLGQIYSVLTALFYVLSGTRLVLLNETGNVLWTCLERIRIPFFDNVDSFVGIAVGTTNEWRESALQRKIIGRERETLCGAVRGAGEGIAYERAVDSGEGSTDQWDRSDSREKGELCGCIGRRERDSGSLVVVLRGHCLRVEMVRVWKREESKISKIENFETRPISR